MLVLNERRNEMGVLVAIGLTFVTIAALYKLIKILMRGAGPLKRKEK